MEGFWAELLRQGYAPLSARNLLLVTAHLGRWLEAEGLALCDLTEDHAAAFLRHRCRQGYTQFRTRRALEPLLGHLRAIGVVPTPSPVLDETPVGLLVREYAGYLSRERGLGASSIRAYTDFARRFVLDERPRLDWDRLTAAEITDFVLDRSRRSSLAGRKLMVTHLRSLLRFLHVRGATAQGLASCVPAVAGWRLAAVPKALEVREIDRLLASFDRSPVGLRDSAIVRLLLRLGLRAGEVAAITLEDVDWRSGEISVQGKGRHQSRLPLPADVGRVLAAYVRHGRPPGSMRSLFLRSRAPCAGMRPGAIIAVARSALRRAGVLAGSAHLLRHTAATQLLRRGASLPEIAHVLRHRHIDTTAIYAKVDLASLGALAQPWPGGAA
ncbi:MAG TPA: tyrosine-type recombinase/integrase [Gaiellaceae bacterium]